MKRVIKFIAILTALVMFLAACAKETENTEEMQTTVQQQNGGNSDMNKLVLISGKESPYRVVCKKLQNVNTTGIIQDFFDDVKNKTGYDLRNVMVNDETEATDKEIVIGYGLNRAEMSDVMAKTSYTGSCIRIVDEKIIVCSYSDKHLEKTLSKLVSAMQKDDDGNWYVEVEFSYELDDCDLKAVPPKYTTADGKIEGVYLSGDGYYEISVSGTTKTEYESYLNTLESKNFELYDDNKIAENLFGTYLSTADGTNTAVYTMFYPTRSVCKIVYGEKGYLPSTQELAYPENSAVTPSITQFGREQVFAGGLDSRGLVGGAPGMGYVIQLADGRYIVIDGGPADGQLTTLKKQGSKWVNDETKITEDTKNLYELLVANNPNEGEPVIAAWLITHAHGDHLGLPIQFMQTYKNDVTIEIFGYNFPDYNTTTVTDGGHVNMRNTLNVLNAVINAIPEEKRPERFMFHTGQELFFAGCEVEILYTQEDYFPNAFANGNLTSAVFRVIMEGKSGEKTVFMVMGDAEKQNCEQIKIMYGEELKCDILQLTHHGFNGACNGIYELMDPDVCFWACDPQRFELDPRCLGTGSSYAFNKWVRENVEKHYTSEKTTTIFVE